MSGPRVPQATRSQWGLLVLASTAFVLSTDLTMVNLALGPIQLDLHCSRTQLGWVVDAYSMAMVSLLIVANPLAERWGQRRIFLVGLVGFGIGSLLAGIGQQIGLLIAGRLIMGLGAAGMLAPGQLLTTALFPPEQRTPAFAAWSSAGALGLCLGPLLGGVLVSHWGWPVVFLINPPLVLAWLLIGVRVLPETAGNRDKRMDGPSVLLSSLGLSLSLGGLLQGPKLGWTSPWLAIDLLTGIGLLMVFLWRQRQLQQPLLNLETWQQARVRQGLIGLFAMTISFNGAQFVAVLRLQEAGWSPLGIGSLLAPYAVVVWLASRAATPMARHFRSAALIRLAHGPLILGFLLLGTGGSQAQLGLICGLALLLSGLGQGLLSPIATVQTYNAMAESQLSSGTSLAMLARFLGASVGVAALDAALAGSGRFSISGALGAILVASCWQLAGGCAAGQTQQSRSVEEG